jgi:hypothetical protein
MKNTIAVGLLMGSLSGVSYSTVIEEWSFGDAAGTTLNNVTNSISGGVSFDAVHSGGATDGSGNYVLNGVTALQNSIADFANITSGIVRLSVNLSGWTVDAVNNDLAQFQLFDGTINTRLVLNNNGGNLRIQGWSGAPGANVGTIATFAATGTLDMVLEVNVDEKTYKILWNYNDTGWSESSVAASGISQVAKLQFQQNALTVGDSVSFDSLRIEQIPEPTTMSLLLISTVGILVVRHGTRAL